MSRILKTKMKTGGKNLRDFGYQVDEVKKVEAKKED